MWASGCVGEGEGDKNVLIFRRRAVGERRAALLRIEKIEKGIQFENTQRTLTTKTMTKWETGRGEKC